MIPSEMPTASRIALTTKYTVEDGGGEREPLQLLALHTGGSAEADEHRGDRQDEEREQRGPATRHASQRSLPGPARAAGWRSRCRCPRRRRTPGVGNANPIVRKAATDSAIPTQDTGRHRDDRSFPSGNQSGSNKSGKRLRAHSVFPGHPTSPRRSISMLEEVGRPFGGREGGPDGDRHPKQQGADPVARRTAEAQGSDHAHPHEREEVGRFADERVTVQGREHQPEGRERGAEGEDDPRPASRPRIAVVVAASRRLPDDPEDLDRLFPALDEARADRLGDDGGRRRDGRGRGDDLAARRLGLAGAAPRSRRRRSPCTPAGRRHRPHRP